MRKAVIAYIDEVAAQTFPADEHMFS